MTELNETNIRHFKLSSGEEIVAVVSGKTTDNMLVLEHPMRVLIAVTDNGFKFMFSTWQPMAKDDTCHINPMHIISHVECSNDIKERYVRMCIHDMDDGDDDTAEGDDSDEDDYIDELLNKDGPTGTDNVH
jgi:hypothetical protein